MTISQTTLITIAAIAAIAALVTVSATIVTAVMAGSATMHQGKSPLQKQPRKQHCLTRTGERASTVSLRYQTSRYLRKISPPVIFAVVGLSVWYQEWSYLPTGPLRRLKSNSPGKRIRATQAPHSGPILVIMLKSRSKKPRPIVNPSEGIKMTFLATILTMAPYINNSNYQRSTLARRDLNNII